MAFDLTGYANKLGADMMAAHGTGATQHGYDYARLPEAERAGYSKAMLVMIDNLEREARRESNSIIAAGLRVAARELGVYRAEKLAKVPQ